MTWRTRALALLMGTTACVNLSDGVDLGETCLAIELDYSGTEQGAVYVKRQSRNESSSGVVSYPSVDRAVGGRRGDDRSDGTSCWAGGLPRDELLLLTAWIDLGGDEETACQSRDVGPAAPPPHLRPACAPDPDDPAGHQVAYVKSKHHNLFLLRIEDQLPANDRASSVTSVK
jgi:hypothetical protein